MASATILDAIEQGDVDHVRTLLDDGFDPNTPVGDDGDLMLCWAAAFAQDEIVRILLASNADVDAVPDHGMGGPALSDALFAGHVATASLLADAGAHVSYADAAALGRLADVQAHDEDHGERWAAFLSACKTGQQPVVEYLVPRGIDVTIYPPGDEYGGIGASGLHWAASGGHEALVRWLVAAGTPIDIVDDAFDNTSLGWVRQDGDEEMAGVLIELGADPERARS
ncbi:MAG: ankyrin repeat domain-containing protein [Acidimicrobiales bacterium]